MGIYRSQCPHCRTDHVAFNIAHSYFRKEGEALCTGVCGNCRLPLTLRLIGYGPAPEKVPGTIEAEWKVVEKWPAISALVAPPHTPDAVARRFVEGENAYRRESWNAAVAMYRSVLDIATKGLPEVPAGQSFYKRLIWLAANQRITPDIKDWADHVRVEGNEALHDPDDFTEEDARPLRLFTEMFLRYVFELPGEVAAFRAQTDGAA